eukprot:scaffold198898_cov22-Tisochrysis_lutea.AAC.1
MGSSTNMSTDMGGKHRHLMCTSGAGKSSRAPKLTNSWRIQARSTNQRWFLEMGPLAAGAFKAGALHSSCY